MNAKRISTHTSKNSDVEVPPLTPAQLKRMRPLREVHPKLYAKLQAENRGKTRITMMLDNDVLEVFRARGGAEGVGYQTLINQALRERIGDKRLDEASLRRIVREELRAQR